ncbi:hypothetical protein ACF1GW_38725 [Streptomyces achromogenes]|uniref:hypothetical protein n=1 Tax=Streptomyces achromogenes TaxID=67255 RepID=UPI0036FDBDA3
MDEKSRRAIAHLAEAIYLLTTVRDQDDQPTVPVTIGENQILISPKTAEAVADAIDTMNSGLDSTIAQDEELAAAIRGAEAVIDIDIDSLNRRKDELFSWLEARDREVIPSGEWSAAAVAQHSTDIYAQVTDVFMLVDPMSYLDDVLAARDPEAAAAAYEQMVTGEWDGEV